MITAATGLAHRFAWNVSSPAECPAASITSALLTRPSTQRAHRTSEARFLDVRAPGLQVTSLPSRKNKTTASSSASPSSATSSLAIPMHFRFRKKDVTGSGVAGVTANSR
jgi:hypothetical protein